ncbi:MAG: homoserine kinase [Nostocoides sp.]
MPAGSPLLPGTSVTVRVPASSANLGPGFDSIGLALGVWDECTATVSDEPGLVVEVDGEGAGEVPLDGSHLVARTMRTAWRDVGVEPPPGLRLHCTNAVPHGRGLGSSATAIVMGIVVAQGLWAAALEGQPIDLEAINDLAARLEGHPDNASASVFGGLTVSWSDDLGEPGATRTVRPSLHPDLDVVVFVPETQLSTAKARSVLPAQVRLADAGANAGRAALLVHAVTADPALLLPATREWLHQEARRESYAASMILVDGLRAAGHAAVISGAGPSVLVLTTRGAAPEVADHGGAGWRVLRPGIPATGSHIVG